MSPKEKMRGDKQNHLKVIFSDSVEISQPALISELGKAWGKALDLSGFQVSLITTEAGERENPNILMPSRRLDRIIADAFPSQ